MDPGHRFVKFIEGFAPTLPRLPIMHVTFGTRFMSILDSLEIGLGPRDEVLEKEVSFHFYGQPSYRPKSGEVFQRSIGSALFCLILDLAHLPPPCSILPFDSGGYSSLLKPFCDGLPVGDFFLPPDADTPARLVSALFGSNEDYFGMRLRPGVAKEVKKFDLHSQGLIRLYGTDGPVPFDQRAGSVEVHFDQPLKLRPEKVLAVIAPDVVAEDDELRAFAQGLDAKIEPYPFDFENPSVRQRQIRDAARKWLTGASYIGPVA